MLKKIFIVSPLILFLIMCDCSGKQDFGVPQSDIPSVISQNWYDSLTFNQKMWGFADRNLSNCDLHGLTLKNLVTITFNKQTKWPSAEKLPQGFDPQKFLEIGLDPGLGVKSLHNKGITGKGVVVAVIDKPILSTHQEFSGRMTYHSLAGNDTRLHFHGLACASNFAGKQCGVAPDVKLHYFAVPDDGKNIFNYSQALEELLRVNATLPSGEKIRIVSISDGISKKSEFYNVWKTAETKIDSAGIILINSNRAVKHYYWGGCPPDKDRNNPKNYEYALMLSGDTTLSSHLILPSDYRTTAGNASPDEYMYWGEGGFSWAMPYLGGMYALALQIDPSLTQSQMDSLIVQTCSVFPNGKVVNPTGFISAVESRK